MELLERAPYLDEMQAWFERAASGEGCVLFLGGEAGVGKTALVQRFCQVPRHTARVLVGSCDALSMPRPLGPLLDIAPGLGSTVQHLLTEHDTRYELFSAVLGALANFSRPTLLVIEDAHWADDATLDLLRFLIRRLEGKPCMLIVTYRDDEVGPKHPLRVVMGDIATVRILQRMTVAPLSETAVARIAEGSSLDVAELHRLTGGNPFYVTEAVAAREPGVPPSVRDAVLARAARLSSDARRVLNVAATIGGTIDVDLLAQVASATAGAIEECVESGMLRAQDRALVFRHELAREAISDALIPTQRAMLHGHVLSVLSEEAHRHPDLAQLAHHAEAAGKRDAVLEFAPAAAAEAASRGAHRQAAAQYARAIRFAGSLPPEGRATLLSSFAYECYVSDRVHEGIAALQEASALWHDAEDAFNEGVTLRWLARLCWVAGQNAEAEAASTVAIEILESLPAGHELAMAYSTRSQLRMLGDDVPGAIYWGDKAIGLADHIGDVEALTHALNNVGSALLTRGGDEGFTHLQRSLDLALRHRLEDHAARAYTNLGSGCSDIYRFDLAERYLSDGISYCVEHDSDFFRLYMTARLALVYAHLGRWDDSIDLASDVLRQPGTAAVTRIMALVALGRCHTRRGDPEAAGILDEALEIALGTGEGQRLGPVHAARAELGWLTGNPGLLLAEARLGLRQAQDAGLSWLIGELSLWLSRAGESPPACVGSAEPFALEIAGQWEQAAEAWRALRCPYEAARAEAASPDEPVLLHALTEFLRLGARPAATMTQRRLREMGVTDIPRGPRPRTQAHPALLTPRESEVLRLIVAGDSNAEIAAQLYVSPKTVEHHITAIFRKLDVTSRSEAIRTATQRSLISI